MDSDGLVDIVYEDRLSTPSRVGSFSLVPSPPSRGVKKW